MPMSGSRVDKPLEVGASDDRWGSAGGDDGNVLKLLELWLSESTVNLDSHGPSDYVYCPKDLRSQL